MTDPTPKYLVIFLSFFLSFIFFLNLYILVDKFIAYVSIYVYDETGMI